MVGILYCAKTTLAYKEIEALLVANGIPARSLAIEEMDGHSLEAFTVLINAMGSYIPEEKIGLLVDFFHSGKGMIHLGPNPFTQDISTGNRNTRYLRSFGIVDDFRPIPEQNTFVKAPNGRKLAMPLTGLHSAVYHLCEKDASGKKKRTGYLEHLLDAFDSQDHFLAVPIIRVVPYQQGSMTFWNFDFDTSMLKDAFWKELFLTTVQKELLGNVLLSVDSDYARYYPQEPQNIHLSLQNISMPEDVTVTLTVSIYDQNHTCIEEQRELVSLPYEKQVSPGLTDSSLYKVVTTVSLEDITIAQNETGFLVISDEELLPELKAFPPMYIDEEVSTDYCLVNGKITPILGTTYFVTDVYRECFYYMNAWLCHKEMAQLKEIGFNVLRTGNWVSFDAFYDSDGSIGERGKRALQTYFLLAARNGFTVQFALGNVMLNVWDKGASAIHNKEMREKSMTLVRSFAESFRNYPNVMLDIVNEPSYSLKGAWSSGRPSGEPEELIRYRQWLSEKYEGRIEKLRYAWGESAAVLQSFEDVQMPDNSLFSRGFCRTEQRKNHTLLADFFTFTRLEFLGWTKQVRETVKKAAPHMIVLMGRDETLRAPIQQDEVLAGNIDMVCWHQWNYNSDILTEYLLNYVPGKLCVAQELGMYKFDDICAGKRHSDWEMAAKLERKLLYSLGNFVQWQSHDDPYMFELSENSLGLYRADMSPTPSLYTTQKLIAAEKNMQDYLYCQPEDTSHIVTLYNTSYYFSVDGSFAYQGIRNHVYALFHCLKESSHVMLEHLFTARNQKVIGNPKLIILPAMQTLSREAWQELMNYAQKGAVLLINGCIDKDEHFAKDAKIGLLDNSYHTRKLMNFEKLIIGEQEYVLNFRQAVGYADATNLLDCGQTAAPHQLSEYTIGKGRLIYCPYPLELSSNTEAVCACYEYAIQRANAQNSIYRLIKGNPNILLLAKAYEHCTVYTLANEGFGDTIYWQDCRSNVSFSAYVKEEGGCKLWISDKGEILQQFGEMTLNILS